MLCIFRLVSSAHAAKEKPDVQRYTESGQRFGMKRRVSLLAKSKQHVLVSLVVHYGIRVTG